MNVVLAVLLAAVLPLRVIPNKITYPVGEKGWFTVVLTNSEAKACSTALKVEEKWGVEGDGRVVWEGNVEIAAREGKTFRVDYPGSKVRYGHEVRVTVAQAGVRPADSSRAEYFCVNDDWWRANQGCDISPKKGTHTPLLRQLQEYYGYPVVPATGTAGALPTVGWERLFPGGGPFPGYCSMITRWQMQKSSVGGNKAAADMPDGKVWYTANGSMRRDSGEIRMDTDVCHEWGVHHTRFTIDFMEGPYGFELARKKPEFILRNAQGAFEGRWRTGDPLKLSIPDNKEPYPWTFVEPNFFREDVVDWALEDLEAGVEGFREDGVYFDGRYEKSQGYDAFGNDLKKTHDTASVQIRNMEKTRKVLLAGRSDRFVWANGPSAKAPYTKLHDDPRCGLLNELQWGFLTPPSTMGCNNYRGFYETVMAGRNIVYVPSKYVERPSKVYMVGYLAPVWVPRKDPGAFRESWTMAQHVMSIVAASLAHPFAAGPQVRNFKQMMERYAEFFWHEDIEVMRDGYKRFVCDSLREIWYDDTIYTRKGAGFTDYYIHLVNVPEGEMCRDDVAEEAPEVDDAEVSTKMFGVENVKAWAVRPYDYMDPVLEPKQFDVPVKSVKGETVFVIPPFRYYTLLIVRKNIKSRRER